jgi:hypothetical protein
MPIDKMTKVGYNAIKENKDKDKDKDKKKELPKVRT